MIDKLGKSPELDRLVYRLTFVQCMYLISIYRLESLRLVGLGWRQRWHLRMFLCGL